MRTLKILLPAIALSCCAYAGDWFATEIQAPIYPILANQARIEGTVRLKLLLDSNGAVSRADIVSGNPVLAHAAQENILKWRFAAACSSSESPQPIEFTYEFKLQGVVDANPRTSFRYEHPYKARVESQALHWMPERAPETKAK